MAGRVLSIQSHVAYGYVGGKAAVFPLQCLGFDVDVVNTVNFSNHSGYGRFDGSRTTAQELSKIFELMKANGLLSPSRLLTGYIPSAEALSRISELAKTLRATNPDLVYLLDPVIGDSGKLYVAPEVVPIYRDLLPQATIITPNWFEVETLTKVTLKDVRSLRLALKILHEEYRVPHVVMSSMPLRDFLEDELPPNLKPNARDGEVYSSGFLICVSSSYIADPQRRRNAAQISTVHSHCLPCIPGYFSGVGDLFSALVLAHFGDSASPSPSPPLHSTTLQTPLSRAVAQALSKTFAILKLTHEAAKMLPAEERTLTDEEKDRAEPDRKVRRMRGRELRLIQGQNILRGASPIELRGMDLWENFWDP